MAKRGTVVSIWIADAGDTICSISHVWHSLMVGTGVNEADVVSLQVVFADETVTGAAVVGITEVPLLSAHSAGLGVAGATEVELLSSHSVGFGVAGAIEVELLLSYSVGFGVAGATEVELLSVHSAGFGVTGAMQSCFGHSKLIISESLYSHPRISEATLMLNKWCIKRLSS